MVPGTGRANLPPWVVVMMATSGSSIITQKVAGVENAKQDLERGSQENPSHFLTIVELSASVHMQPPRPNVKKHTITP